MAYSKKEQFKDPDIKISRFAKALAHPARVAVLKILFERGTCICGDFVEALPLSQSTVSQHLNELKGAGIVNSRIDGPRVAYTIDDRNWALAKHHLGGFFNRLGTAA
jgi:DNA-binding transcriptional ArsR family regulator